MIIPSLLFSTKFPIARPNKRLLIRQNLFMTHPCPIQVFEEVEIISSIALNSEKAIASGSLSLYYYGARCFAIAGDP